MEGKKAVFGEVSYGNHQGNRGAGRRFQGHRGSGFESQGIGQSLFDDIGQSEADFVATDCETCKWQIEMSTFVPVMNPISILAEALDEEATMEANKEFCK